MNAHAIDALICAMIAQAIKDSQSLRTSYYGRKASYAAMQWLAETGTEWCDVMGWDVDVLPKVYQRRMEL